MQEVCGVSTFAFDRVLDDLLRARRAPSMAILERKIDLRITRKTRGSVLLFDSNREGRSRKKTIRVPWVREETRIAARVKGSVRGLESFSIEGFFFVCVTVSIPLSYMPDRTLHLEVQDHVLFDT